MSAMFSKKFPHVSFRSGGKRSATSPEKEHPLAPPDKVQRCELDDEEEDQVELPEELLAHLKKYSQKHFSDKVIKEKILEFLPVPKNVPKPSEMDLYIKDLVKESANPRHAAENLVQVSPQRRFQQIWQLQGLRKNLHLSPVSLPLLKDFPRVHPLVESLLNPNLEGNFPLAGRNWDVILSDRFILNTVSSYQVPFVSQPQQLRIPSPIPMDKGKMNLVDLEVASLKEKGQ